MPRAAVRARDRGSRRPFSSPCKDTSMTERLSCCITLLLWVFPLVPVRAADADDREIQRLVRQLGSNRFRERQAAAKRLEEIGEPALGALQKATDTLEVRRR